MYGGKGKSIVLFWLVALPSFCKGNFCEFFFFYENDAMVIDFFKEDKNPISNRILKIKVVLK